MATLIVDIETVGEQWDELDDDTQISLIRWLDTAVCSAEEKRLHLERIKNSLGLSPMTGRIVTLGVYDITRKEGTIYYESDEVVTDVKEGPFYYRIRDEETMLREFWLGVLHYDTIVTFNGRAFDVPFIIHRSVAHGLTPVVDLLRYRYLTNQQPPYHIDLLDQLTFYGAMKRRPNLHLFCRLYGVPSPKTADMMGDTVAEFFSAKKFRDLANYNATDLLAIAGLYKKWQTHLAPSLFRRLPDNIDF